MIQKKKKKSSVKTETDLQVDTASDIETVLEDKRFLKGVHKPSTSSPSSSIEDDDDLGEDSEEARELSIEEMQQFLIQNQAVPGQPLLIHSDKFRVVSDAFLPEFVTALELPKMILKKTREDEQTINDKSVLMVYLSVTRENIKKGCFQQLYKAARKGPIKLQLVWLDEPTATKSKTTSLESEELSVWKFEDARIHGIDFGNAMAKRADINMITVEVTYNNVSIDGVSL